MTLVTHLNLRISGYNIAPSKRDREYLLNLLNLQVGHLEFDRKWIFTIPRLTLDHSAQAPVCMANMRGRITNDSIKFYGPVFKVGERPKSNLRWRQNRHLWSLRIF